MICPTCRIPMHNYEEEEVVFDARSTAPAGGLKTTKFVPLPFGGISNDEVYETWEVKKCSQCGRKVKEAYRCELMP